MPKRRDLTGEQFGQLVVLGIGEHIVYGGKRQSSWRTECGCGRIEVFPATALTSGRRKSCSHCARPECTECGKPFERSGPTQRYCSPECTEIARQRQWREYYYRRVDDDEESVRRAQRASRANRSEYQRLRERVDGREADAKRRDTIRNDPDRLEAQRAYHREWRRAWIALKRLDPEEYAEWRRQQNKSAKVGYNKNREKILTNRQEMRRQQALDELMQIVSRASNRGENQ